MAPIATPTAPPPESEPVAAGVPARRGIRGALPFMGPAFIAAIAYVDPGNFATNIAGGSEFGYLLLWVILTANLMAMLIQNLSAKAGMATGKNLPELCREHWPKRTNFLLWLQAEIVAMATDLAEFVGAAIALNLLFGIPLFPAGLITAVVAFSLLGLQSRGRRRYEVVIAGMLGVILLGFLFDTMLIDHDAAGIAGGFVPGFEGSGSLLLATGILGATVMPHVIYLHSALTQDRVKVRDAAEKKRLLRFQRIDIFIAMGIAGVINMSMLVIAASLFHDSGLDDIDTIEGAHAGFDALIGNHAAIAFALALLASGFAASSVGTQAGQVVMQGFVNRTIPLALRRGVTMAPALVVLAIGVNPTEALIVSQVVLSFGIPFALVPLILLTRRRDVMGSLVNRRVTTIVAGTVACMIIGLNGFLLFDTFTG